jgi:hypothetical protein
MNSVGHKLEAALKSYVAANWKGTGEPLNGATLYRGHTPDEQSTRDKVGFYFGAVGGPHAQQGSYEIPVQMIVETSMAKAAGTETEASLLLLHGQRVEALLGIFSDARVATVAAALMAIDSELGVSAYWHESATEENNDFALRTVITKVFAAHLV